MRKSFYFSDQKNVQNNYFPKIGMLYAIGSKFYTDYENI